MGLDMSPLAAPKPGCEAEFAGIVALLKADRNGAPRDLSFFQRMRWKPPQFDEEATIARFQEISVAPFENLGAPVVGRDAAADDWVREMRAEGRLGGDPEDDAAAIAGMEGYHVLALLPPCDGFPVYSNGGAYDGVDQCSFRGQLLGNCGACLPKELIARAWELMDAEELGAWSEQLAAAATAFAEAQGCAAVLGVAEPRWRDLDGEGAFDFEDGKTLSAAAQAHVVDALARWGRFWAAKGHGSEPWS